MSPSTPNSKNDAKAYPGNMRIVIQTTYALNKKPANKFDNTPEGQFITGNVNQASTDSIRGAMSNAKVQADPLAVS